MAIDFSTDGGIAALHAALSSAQTAREAGSWDAMWVAFDSYALIHAGIPRGQFAGANYNFPAPEALEKLLASAEKRANRRTRPRVLSARTNYHGPVTPGESS